MVKNKEKRGLNTAEWLMIGSGVGFAVLAAIMAVATGNIVHSMGVEEEAFKALTKNS